MRFIILLRTSSEFSQSQAGLFLLQDKSSSSKMNEVRPVDIMKIDMMNKDLRKSWDPYAVA